MEFFQSCGSSKYFSLSKDLMSVKEFWLSLETPVWNKKQRGERKIWLFIVDHKKKTEQGDFDYLIEESNKNRQLNLAMRCVGTTTAK